MYCRKLLNQQILHARDVVRPRRRPPSSSLKPALLGTRCAPRRVFPSLPPPTFARACACAYAKKYGWLASLLPCAMPVATVGCSIDIRDYVTGMGNLSRDPHYGRTICAYVDSFGWLLDKDGGEERLETVYLQFHCLSKGNPYMFRIESVHCLQRSKIDC